MQGEELLRLLSLGLSAFRLFPDDPERSGALMVAGRVRAAAREVLAAGPLEVEVVGERLEVGGTVVAGDEPIRRLALACHDRRVERLRLAAVPEDREVLLLYRVLSLPASEVERMGGAARALGAWGAGSIVLEELGPPPSEAPGRRAETVSRGHGGPGWLGDPAEVAARMAAEAGGDPREGGGGGAPGEAGASPWDRLRALAEGLAEVRASVDLNGQLHAVIAHLPPALRRAVVSELVDRVPADPVAQRVLGSMTNAELARAVADLRHAGRDPVHAARRLAGVSGPGLVDLTQALLRGQEEAGTIMTGLANLGLDLGRAWDGRRPLMDTVSDLLARGLREREGADARSIREEFPDPVDGRAELPWRVLDDYLRLETDGGRLRQAMTIWGQELRWALRTGDHDTVRRLAAALDRAMEAPGPEATVGRPTGERNGGSPAEPERRAVLDSAVRRALEDGLLSDLLGGDGDRVGRTLGPLAGRTVDALLDLLAEDGDREWRARLLGVIRRLASGHRDVVARRLRDHRWFVVRNAVSVLGWTGDPSALGPLEEAARHPVAAVRREAILALVAAGGERAVPAVRRMALEDRDAGVRGAAVVALGGLVGGEAVAGLSEVAIRSPDPEVRRMALHQLAGHPAPEAVPTLLRLSSRRSRPRLPRRLRRQARELLLRRGEGKGPASEGPGPAGIRPPPDRQEGPGERGAR